MAKKVTKYDLIDAISCDKKLEKKYVQIVVDSMLEQLKKSLDEVTFKVHSLGLEFAKEEE